MTDENDQFGALGATLSRHACVSVGEMAVEGFGHSLCSGLLSQSLSFGFGPSHDRSPDMRFQGEMDVHHS